MRVTGSRRRGGSGAGDQWWKRRRLLLILAIVALVAANVVLFALSPQAPGEPPAEEKQSEQQAAPSEGTESQGPGEGQAEDGAERESSPEGVTVMGADLLAGVSSFDDGLFEALEAELRKEGVDPAGTTVEVPREARVDQTGATVWFHVVGTEKYLTCSYDGIEDAWSCAPLEGVVAGVND